MSHIRMEMVSWQWSRCGVVACGPQEVEAEKRMERVESMTLVRLQGTLSMEATVCSAVKFSITMTDISIILSTPLYQ